MAQSLHTAASSHLPSFITAPNETDILMVVTAVVLAVSVLMFGVLFFWLHALPERIAHKSKKIQLELVALLALISLFTHMHIFWIAGLVLAFVEVPDFGVSLGRIAGSVERIADAATDQTPVDEIQTAPALSEKDETDEDFQRQGNVAVGAPGRLEMGPREVARV
jgi:hypothetical protein